MLANLMDKISNSNNLLSVKRKNLDNFMMKIKESKKVLEKKMKQL